MQMIITDINLQKMVKTKKWRILIDHTKSDIQKLLDPGWDISLRNKQLLWPNKAAVVPDTESVHTFFLIKLMMPILVSTCVLCSPSRGTPSLNVSLLSVPGSHKWRRNIDTYALRVEKSQKMFGIYYVN